ncbi:N-acetylmuramoyl-L-alanine amidase family protein [Niveispirillum fermenti]|uniref:N-acetylmuramoyl-L-alanine amidase family protein n=1 Tax=Niveispirillum fermenti TaxID=1233113 RepID=UPI003A8B46E5
MTFFCLVWLVAANVAMAQAPVQTAAVAATMPATLPGPARILAARMGDHGDKTRFVLELTRDTHFILDASRPQMVVVDLEASIDSGLPPGKGLVRNVRLEPGASASRLRLVLSTTAPVHIQLAEIIPPRDGMPPRFILDLGPAPAGTGAAALTPASVSTLAPPPPPKAKPRPELPMIVLDAGHGGQDPGTIGVGGAYEKDIVLAVTLELRRQLLATGRYRVALTRDKDLFIPLRQRVAIARTKGADLFISLHADSIASRNIRGLSVYTLSDKASDREAEMLAQRENQADAIVGMDLSVQSSDIANILISLSQRDTMNQSRHFASLVVRHVDKQVPVLPSPLRSAGLAVLTAPDVPSVLVELGYLSHPQDARLLATDAHRRRLAGSLVRAVDGYFSSQR